jgi:DNA-directed RNA polymerase subunit RPC12/RpoP
MAVYEVLTVALDVVLAAATTAALYYGLLGMIGQFFVVRCASCGHLTSSSADQQASSCLHCRHPVLLHPMQVLRPRRHPSERPAA